MYCRIHLKEKSHKNIILDDHSFVACEMKFSSSFFFNFSIIIFFKAVLFSFYHQQLYLTETVKESIRKTAKEFLSVMPMFCQRLAQRDYDLILVSPMKRRMLLKMFCMGQLEVV